MPPDAQQVVLAHLDAPTVHSADALARAVTPFVESLARRHHCPDPLVSFEDLVLSGMLGVFEALERYDPARNVPFLAFARRRIWGAQVAYLRTLDPLARKARSDLAHVRRLEDEAHARTGRAPAADAVAAEAGMDPRRLAYLKHASALRHRSTAARDDEDDAVDRLAGDSVTDDAAERRSLLDHLDRALDTLDPRTRKAVRLYYLGGLSFVAIGHELDVSNVSAARYVRHGIEALREVLADTPRQAA